LAGTKENGLGHEINGDLHAKISASLENELQCTAAILKDEAGLNYLRAITTNVAGYINKFCDRGVAWEINPITKIDRFKTINKKVLMICCISYSIQKH
jgi:hypothetical protein